MKHVVAFIAVLMLAGCSSGSGSLSHLSETLGISESASNSESGPPAPPHGMGTQTTEVTLTSTVGGSLSPFDGTENLTIGYSMLVYANAYTGYRFDHWNITDDSSATQDTRNNLAIPITEGLVVEAIFVQVVSN